MIQRWLAWWGDGDEARDVVRIYLVSASAFGRRRSATDIRAYVNRVWPLPPIGGRAALERVLDGLVARGECRVDADGFYRRDGAPSGWYG